MRACRDAAGVNFQQWSADLPLMSVETKWIASIITTNSSKTLIMPEAAVAGGPAAHHGGDGRGRYGAGGVGHGGGGLQLQLRRHLPHDPFPGGGIFTETSLSLSHTHKSAAQKSLHQI